MVFKNYLKLFVAFAVLFLANDVQALENSILSAKMQREHQAGTVFKIVSLFTPTTGAKHDVLQKENLLVPNKATIEALYGEKPQAVTISFTDNNTGKVYVLDMMRSNPVAENANFGYINHGERVRSSFVDGIHYQGAVYGSVKSLATMSVFADGTVMAMFANEEGNFIVGQLTDGTGNYVFYNDKDMVAFPGKPCETKDDVHVIGNNTGGQAKTTGVNLCHKVQVYWEVNYEIYQNKGSNITTTRNYMIGLFNEFQAMYVNENISMELKSLYVWTTNDGYPKATSSEGLDIFKGYWNGRGDDFDGDIAHILTRHNAGNGGGNGGLAYVDILNARNFAYAYSDIYGTYSGVPTYSWDVMVVTHETGHNLGSRHTHWCGWMTGPGATCGSIDDCNTKDASTTCSSCVFETFKDSDPVSAWAGTVMSYCHLRTRKTNLANGFGPLPGTVIRDEVSTATNLKPVISATLKTTPICAADGSIDLVFNTNNFGVKPYTFLWNNNAATQNITGITLPGSYDVKVTDSNGCFNEFKTNLTKYARPGDASATGYIKPVCCDQAPATITLSATVPVDLSSCQTVAWLRTPAALTTYADAQTAFAAATTADIITSTNTSAISNSTAATLDVTSPSPCVATSYYYTPFVTRKPKAIHAINSIVSVNTPVTQASVNIGSAVLLSDETGLVTTCDAVDTASSKTLNVTVIGYTGRANNMTILLVDVDNDVVISRQTGLAGNGIYSINIDSVKTPLKKLSVEVFDFNCSDGNTCVGSAVAITAARSVVYPAVTQVVLDKACVVGQSVQLGFAPTDCEAIKFPIGIGNVGIIPASLNVYPNPASKSVTVQFIASENGVAAIKVTDAVGKVVENRKVSFVKGDNLVQIDVHNWAKGVYSLSFNDGKSSTQNIKLVVQ